MADGTDQRLPPPLALLLNPTRLRRVQRISLLRRRQRREHAGEVRFGEEDLPLRGHGEELVVDFLDHPDRGVYAQIVWRP